MHRRRGPEAARLRSAENPDGRGPRHPRQPCPGPHCVAVKPARGSPALPARHVSRAGGPSLPRTRRRSAPRPCRGRPVAGAARRPGAAAVAGARSRPRLARASHHVRRGLERPDPVRCVPLGLRVVKVRTLVCSPSRLRSDAAVVRGRQRQSAGHESRGATSAGGLSAHRVRVVVETATSRSRADSLPNAGFVVKVPPCRSSCRSVVDQPRAISSGSGAIDAQNPLRSQPRRYLRLLGACFPRTPVFGHGTSGQGDAQRITVRVTPVDCRPPDDLQPGRRPTGAFMLGLGDPSGFQATVHSHALLHPDLRRLRHPHRVDRPALPPRAVRPPRPKGRCSA